MVMVPKADGQVRICGDFKATINPLINTEQHPYINTEQYPYINTEQYPYINTEQYPLPTADDLFQKIQGGTRFTKLNLKIAYLQMEVLYKSLVRPHLEYGNIIWSMVILFGAW